MASAVRLRSYHQNKKIVLEGPALMIDKYIITHYSTIGVHPNQLTAKNLAYIPIDVYLVKKLMFSVKEMQVKMIHSWQCETFISFFKKYFNLEDFGNKNVDTCATFILLNAKLDSETSILDISLTIPGTSMIYQGDRIFTITDCNRMNTLCRNERRDVTISYVFACGSYFTIDVDANPGSIVYRLKNGDGVDCVSRTSILGLVIYNDSLPHPFQVFPLCITFNHLLSEACRSSSCASVLGSIPSLPGLEEEYKRRRNYSGIYLVQCGNNIGTGSLIDDTVILTCSHILAQHTKFGVTVFLNDRPHTAKVIYKVADQEWPDLALIQIAYSNKTSPHLTPKPIASDSVSLGDRVFAIGIPYIKGWHSTEPWMSAGKVVSKSSRHIVASCSVHEGFSGGCLLDIRGHILGVICGKAFPIDQSFSPPRLAQVISVTEEKDEILRFINSERNTTDTHYLTKLFVSRSQNFKMSKL